MTNSETFANILDGLGEARRGKGDLTGAWEVQRESLDIRLALFPQGHLKRGVSFSNLGLTLLQSGEFALATDALEKAVAIQQTHDDPVRLANAAINLSGAYGAQERFKDAVAMAETAQQSLARALPSGHVQAVAAGFNLAWLQLGAGNSAAALPVARTAFEGFRASGWRLSSEETLGAGQFRDQRRQVLALVAALWEEAPENGLDEAFRAVQWAQASEAAHVARRVAARFAAGEGALAALVRQRQELTNLWDATDAQFLSMLGTDRGKAMALREQLPTIEAEIANVDAALAQQFPQYARLTAPGGGRHLRSSSDAWPVRRRALPGNHAG